MLEELNLLRSHNKTFKEGDSQSNILLFSEALLTLTCLERFLRILPDVESNAKNCLKKKKTSKSEPTLPDLLDSTLQLKLLNFQNPDLIKKAITDIRNSIIHGNFEQCAKRIKLSSTDEYFKTVFINDIEESYNFLCFLLKQIDPMTGKPRSN